MLINVGDITTFPEEIEAIVYDYLRRLPPEQSRKIKNHKIEFERDVEAAIEADLNEWRARDLYDKLMDVLQRYEFACYHATRVLDLNELRRNGLKCNSWPWYSSNMRQVLSALGVCGEEIKDSLSLIQEEYHKKCEFPSAKPAICFFMPMISVDNSETTDYRIYTENIGGELASGALERSMPEVYRLLCNNGEPTIVEFQVPFSAVSNTKKDVIIFKIIAFYAAKFYWDFDYMVQLDAQTEEDIDSSMIRGFTSI